MAYKNWKKTGSDNYQRITDKFVDALQEVLDGKREHAPWIRPWSTCNMQPHNGHSGYTYNGINVFLTWATSYTDPRWYTFNQLATYYKGASVKGQKGTQIVKWVFLKKKVDSTDKDGNTTKVEKSFPVLKVYSIFNHEQVTWGDKQPKPLTQTQIQEDPETRYASVANLVKASGATIQTNPGRACYQVAKDVIGMPEAKTFNSVEAYWATLLHEMTHWTGHPSRCNRNLKNRFGSEAYAAEELVAELGSAFLCADLGVQGKVQHQQYIESWIKVLKNDKHAIFSAARLAMEAAKYLQGEQLTEDIKEAA